jgi:recombination associated protein RdgC
MASSPFKSFIPYLIKTGLVSDLDDYKSTDPSGASWTTHGFVPALPGDSALVESLETGGKLLCVQINDRILPGKVRDEELKKRVAKLEAAEARKVSKKEYAQLRDEVEFELLPKAFIRRTKVYVAILQGHRIGENFMLVFTSSQKKADEVVSLINVATGMPNPPWKIQTDWPLAGRLTTLARDCEFEPDDGPTIFEATDCAVLKGEDKQTIRIKDKDLSDSDAVRLVKEGYEVHEIGVGMIDDRGEGHAITFVLNTNLTFKRLTFPSVKQHDDLYAEAVFVMPNLRELLSAFFQLPVDGGFGLLPAMPVNAADDEDEL